MPFPDLELSTLEGEPLPLSRWVTPGRRSLVNIWATYCVPCNEEMPELQRLRAAFERAGIDLLGVSIDIDTAEAIPDFLETRGIDYPIMLTSEEQVPRIYARGEVLIPMSVLLDDRLRVIEVHSGWSDETRAAIHALAGVADPPSQGSQGSQAAP